MHVPCASGASESAIRSGQSAVGLGTRRLVVGTTCYAAEVAGAVLLMLGHVAGIYLAAVAMTALVAFMISGAWLLVAGVHRDIHPPGVRAIDPASVFDGS